MPGLNTAPAEEKVCPHKWSYIGVQPTFNALGVRKRDEDRFLTLCEKCGVVMARYPEVVPRYRHYDHYPPREGPR